MVFLTQELGTVISRGELEGWPERHDSVVCMLSLSMLGIHLLPIYGLCKVSVVTLWDWVVDLSLVLVTACANILWGYC